MKIESPIRRGGPPRPPPEFVEGSGAPAYRQTGTGGLPYVYPVRNNAPLGFESQRLEFLTGFTIG